MQLFYIFLYFEYKLINALNKNRYRIIILVIWVLIAKDTFSYSQCSCNETQCNLRSNKKYLKI